MKLKIYSTLIIFVASLWPGCFSSFAQVPGCTDFNAKNYNPEATINDGTCHYKRISLRLKNAFRLSDSIDESSGLIYSRGYLITHNDGGNAPVLFILKPEDGSVVKKVFVKNSTNIDWEEICQDSHYVYIGDFGNNNGNRADLAIYCINKTALLALPDSVNTQWRIQFSYEDQFNLETKPYRHNFDCEAFIVYKDTFWLFTKNWQNHFTKLYALPVEPKSQIAVLKDSFFINGLVTASEFDPENHILYLLGYNHYKAFIGFFYDFRNSDYFGGHFQKIKLLNREQAEGLCLYDNRFYISTELSLAGKNKLYSLKKK